MSKILQVLNKNAVRIVFVMVFLFISGKTIHPKEETCRIDPPFAIEYGVYPDRTGKTAYIKTAIAEYFRQENGKALFYIVFYPYQIKPENWRDIQKYEKTSPSDFVVIKLEIRGEHPLKAGEYLSTESDISGSGNRFTPQLQIPGVSFEGTRGRGKLVINSVEIQKHGKITGFIDYQDSNFYIKGNFEGRVYSVK